MPRGGERLLRFWFFSRCADQRTACSRLCRVTSFDLSVVLNICLDMPTADAAPDPSSPHLFQLG